MAGSRDVTAGSRNTFYAYPLRKVVHIGRNGDGPNRVLREPPPELYPDRSASPERVVSTVAQPAALEPGGFANLRLVPCEKVVQLDHDAPLAEWLNYGDVVLPVSSRAHTSGH